MPMIACHFGLDLAIAWELWHLTLLAEALSGSACYWSLTTNCRLLTQPSQREAKKQHNMQEDKDDPLGNDEEEENKTRWTTAKI